MTYLSVEGDFDNNSCYFDGAQCGDILRNDSVIPNPLMKMISMIFCFLVGLTFLCVSVNGCDINISTVARLLGKPHVRILSVQPEFCRKGGGGPLAEWVVATLQ